MKNYFKRIFGEKKKPFMFTTRNMARPTGNGDRIINAGGQMSNILLIDDIISSSSWGTATNSNGVFEVGTPMPVQVPLPSDIRKAVEPKEVFEEIKKENIEFSFDNLDEKIKVVSERINILKEHLDEGHLADEHRSLFYLKNRKSYLKTKDKNPLDWAMTNQDAIDDLCKNYKLKVVPLKQYYTLVPNEGIKEMDRYTKAYKAITGDLPIFELVIKDADVKSEEAKQQKKKDRDPILLANSPLGNFLFVIGAWDDEVEIVDEIIYQGK